MKNIIFLTFFSAMLLFSTMANSEETVYTVYDVIKPGALDGNYKPKDYANAYEKELEKETIFHVNGTESPNPNFGLLYDTVPIIKIELFYIFSDSQAKGLGYLGSFEYKSLIYKKKNRLGVRLRTGVEYNKYH